MESPLPLRLTEPQVAALFPPVRCFHRFDSAARSDMQASHRLGFRQKERVGEYYYTHPLIAEVCFPSPARAKAAGWVRYQELEEAEWAALAYEVA